MAKIQINGKKVVIKQNFTLQDVLKKYKLNKKNRGGFILFEIIRDR